jgi:hypothetical protein
LHCARLILHSVQDDRKKTLVDREKVQEDRRGVPGNSMDHHGDRVIPRERIGLNVVVHWRDGFGAVEQG